MSTPLDTGDRALDFALPADGGGEIRLSALRGRKVVLYFYPQDDTELCTRQAVDFTRLAGEFAAAGAVVVGVSKDSVADHDAFKAKHALGLRLASDAADAVAERYGAWGEKNMYGRIVTGMIRTTFLIDAEGIIRRVWRRVRTPGHAQAVLDAARGL